jgi:hypothetical protein
MNLRETAAKWSTPIVSFLTLNDKESVETFDRRRTILREKYRNNGAGEPLAVQVRRWSTPTARDVKGSDAASRRRNTPSLPVQAIERDGADTSELVVLNPYFVEALQGFPQGWTALDVLGTP